MAAKSVKKVIVPGGEKKAKAEKEKKADAAVEEPFVNITPPGEKKGALTVCHTITTVLTRLHRSVRPHASRLQSHRHRVILV